MNCKNCNHPIHKGAPACPNCGRFVGGPTLAGSFAIGVAGSLTKFFGGFCLLLCAIASLMGGSALFWLALGVVSIWLGTYWKYISRQTVRTISGDGER